MENEIWIEFLKGGYKAFYISNLGRVKSVHKNAHKILKQRITKLGYCTFSHRATKASFLVHRLVAIAFIQNNENKKFVNHKDGNKLNNNRINLEWVTQSENEKHAHLTGLKNFKGERHSKSKLTDNDVIQIKQMHSAGLTSVEISKKFPVSSRSIRNINQGRNWTHINI